MSTVHSGSWADVTLPPHGGHHTGLKAFSQHLRATHARRRVESSVMSQHLQLLDCVPAQHSSRGMDHTQHQQASPEPGCDHLWFSDLVLPPASCHLTHELLQQSPQLKLRSSPLFLIFIRLPLIRHPPSLRQPPRGRRSIPRSGRAPRAQM